MARSFDVQEDGKIVVVGTDGLYRVNPDGSPDQRLSPQPGWAVVIQPDGRIVYALDYVSAAVGPRVQRFNADGSIDSSFSCPVDPAAGNGRITNMVLAPDGDLYISDEFQNSPGYLIRLNSDGSIDEGFARVGLSDSTSRLVLLQPDGKLLVPSDDFPGRIARINSDGTLDPSFSAPATVGSAVINAAVRQADGTYYIGGRFRINDGQTNRDNLVRLMADGSLDPTFAPAPEDQQSVDTPISTQVLSLALQSDGKLIVGNLTERFAPFGPTNFRRKLAARFNPDGSRDTSFATPDGSRGTGSIRPLPNGKVLVGGEPILIGGESVGLSLLSQNGQPELPFARFDYSGDRRADLVVYRPSNQLWYVNNGQTNWTFGWGVPTDIPVPADYDGDAKTDLAVFRPSEGNWYIVNSSNLTFFTIRWGESGDVPLATNARGDRKAAFTIFRPSNLTWYRTEGTSFSQSQTVQFGSVGDIPIVGKYRTNMGFESTITVYRPSTRTFLHRTWTNDFIESKLWGIQTSDIPVAGDFDGDLVTDFAVYRPSVGQWRIELSSDQSLFVRNWGVPGDVPVVADYDGDRRDDVAIYRPSTGQWYIWGSTEGISIRNWGEPGDEPAPAAYLP